MAFRPSPSTDRTGSSWTSGTSAPGRRPSSTKRPPLAGHYVQVIDVNGGTGTYSLVAKDSSFSTPTPTPTATATPTASPTATETSTPVPDGPVRLEAESASGGADFEPFTVGTDPDASGGEYIYTADVGRNNHGGPSTDLASPPFSGDAAAVLERR